MLRYTPPPVQSEEKKPTFEDWRPTISKRVQLIESSDSDSDAGSSSDSDSVPAAAVIVQDLKERLSFFRPEVQEDFNTAQWRFLDGADQEHQEKLVREYRKRLAVSYPIIYYSILYYTMSTRLC